MKYYHIWFQTKFKKYLLVDIIDARVHDLFRQIAEEKKIKLLASGSLPDHMHLLIGLEGQQDLSWAVKQFKGISSRKIFQEVKLLKQDFRVNNFWARRYGAKEVPPEGIKTTINYVLNQKKDLHII
jgi:putative transposase